MIRNDSPLMMVALFYLAGLGLAFTPCVLPMVPILSGIIAGGGKNLTTARAFMLSLTYVLGMAVTYTAAGVAGAAMGKEVQGAVPAVVGPRLVRGPLCGDGAVDVRAVHRADAGGDPDAHRAMSAIASPPAPSAVLRSWARFRRSS